MGNKAREVHVQCMLMLLSWFPFVLGKNYSGNIIFVCLLVDGAIHAGEGGYALKTLGSIKQEFCLTL